MAKRAFKVYVQLDEKNHHEYMCGGDDLLESLEFFLKSPFRKELKKAISICFVPDED